MATTQEYYRLGSRLPRYTTTLNAFANGMYLTDQTIPEGYVKVMANYDIDDTGSHIRPRAGRELVQHLKYVDTDSLGPASITDYIYSYNKAGDTVEDVQDVVLSYGVAPMIESSLSKVYADIGLSNEEIIVADLTYNKFDDTYGDEDDPDPTEVHHFGNFWGLNYNKDKQQFENIVNESIGSFPARVIKQAYAFDKAVSSAIVRPVATVLDNELLAFTTDKISYDHYTRHPERSQGANIGTFELTKLKLINDGGAKKLRREVVQPYEPNILTAATSGFNLLQPAPYDFEWNTRAGALFIVGMLPYNNEGKIYLGPNIGETVTLKVQLQYAVAGADTWYKIELANADYTGENPDYEVYKDYDQPFKVGETDFSIEAVCRWPRTYVRVTVRDAAPDSDSASISASTWLLDSTNPRLKNLDYTNYDLSTARGMVSWQGCLGLYRVAEAANTIFFSDAENPGYFPFPYNTLTFENEILAVHNYLDNLIVVTVESIWVVTPGTSVMTSIQTKVLANIHIPEIDAMNLVVLKDQIFFKTDTQFYVLKPNSYTSDATDLKNYTNSTAISNYTNSFTVETTKLFNKLYPKIWQEETINNRVSSVFDDFKVHDIHSVIKNEEVHYIYKVQPKLKDQDYMDFYLNLHLVYNTLVRSWRLYLIPIGDSTTAYNPVLYKQKQSGAFYEFFPHINGGEGAITISKQTNSVVTDDVVYEGWSLLKDTGFNNFPYIDTGVVAIDETFTKRFREVQFSLVNQDKDTIKFFTKFFLDGQERVSSTKYQMQHITDVEDPEYGSIYVTPIETENLYLYGETDLASDVSEEDQWALDLSKFPELANITVRFQLQGRGRRGSLQLLNTSLQRYQLSTLNWVYRTMSAR